MDPVLKQEKRVGTFNGPLEAGVRAVALLGATYPRTYDLQRLVAFDFLLVHTGDVGGPESLHPPTPHHSAELLVRRQLVEDALLLMMTRDLVRRHITPDGITYGAGENAATFLASLSTSYLRRMKERASWLAEALGDHKVTEFRAVMRRFFDDWVEEFQNVERSMGER
jgi:hypothetical protein